MPLGECVDPTTATVVVILEAGNDELATVGRRRSRVKKEEAVR